MNKETTGTVVSVSRQWWLKVNTKVVRMHALDGATFPHIIKIKYTVDGKDYTVRKWIKAGEAVPQPGTRIDLVYAEDKPSRVKLI